MGVGTLQTAVQLLICVLATALYAWPLSRREGFPARAGLVLAAWAVGCAVALSLGYTLFPVLTDDASFLSAIGVFGLVVAALAGSVAALWKATPWAALFCASSGYLVQSIVFGLDRLAHVLGIVRPSFDTPGSLGDAASLAVCSAIVFAGVHLAMTGRIERRGLAAMRNLPMLFAVGVAMAVSIVLDLAVKDIMVADIPFRYIVVFTLAYEAVCLFILIAEFEILYNQALSSEVAAMERTMAEQERQFSLSKSTIEAINSRVHDIRHQVARLLAEGSAQGISRGRLAEVIHRIDIYDSAVRTGNSALDVILTEKGLVCEARGIGFSCIADGDALAFMGSSDLYAFLGTILDEAIEASEQMPAERRSISFTASPQMGMSSVGIRYYCPEGTRLSGGLPAEESLNSETIQAVVEKHAGTIVYSIEDGALCIDALFPLP